MALTKFVRDNILWKLVVYATVWKLWLERNRRVFINKSKSAEEVVESIVWTVWEWVCNCKHFIDVSLEDLNRSWAVVLKGSWRSRIVQRQVWNHPRTGIVKLNFDGSFVQSVQQGGVIKDLNGIIIRNFSGPVHSSNANKAELFGLLIGCRELHRIGVLNSILEGDSFSSI